MIENLQRVAEDDELPLAVILLAVFLLSLLAHALLVIARIAQVRGERRRARSSRALLLPVV